VRRGGWYTIREQDAAKCPTCGSVAAWRSNREGRRYLAAVRPYRAESGWLPILWVTHAPHACPPPRPAQVEVDADVCRRILSASVEPALAVEVRKSLVVVFGEERVAATEAELAREKCT